MQSKTNPHSPAHPREKLIPTTWIRLKSYHGPVKVIVAAEDEIIPAEAGRRQFAAYAGLKDLMVVPGARHNEVAEQSPEWWREVIAFRQANASRVR